MEKSRLQSPNSFFFFFPPSAFFARCVFPSKADAAQKKPHASFYYCDTYCTYCTIILTWSRTCVALSATLPYTHTHTLATVPPPHTLSFRVSQSIPRPVGRSSLLDSCVCIFFSCSHNTHSLSSSLTHNKIPSIFLVQRIGPSLPPRLGPIPFL